MAAAVAEFDIACCNFEGVLKRNTVCLLAQVSFKEHEPLCKDPLSRTVYNRGL